LLSEQEVQKEVKMISARKFMLVAFLVVLLGSAMGIQAVWAEGDDESPDDWMEGCTLVITEARNINEAYEAADVVEKAGGRIGVIVPNQVMLGWVPVDKVKSLVGRAHIREIHKKPLSAIQRDRALVALTPAPDSLPQNAIELFNQVVTGEYKVKNEAARARIGAPAKRLPDLLEPPLISYDDYMANLKANGITEETLKNAGIVIQKPADGQPTWGSANSDFMVGKVVFNAIFVESIGRVDGVGDPNKYTWTVSARDTTNAEIVVSLMWWANRARAEKYKVPLTFISVSRDRWRTKQVCTRWEPILHSSNGDYLWIEEIMANFGFAIGNKIDRTAAFNTAQRINWNTNWAVTSFIGYNPFPAPTKFTDDHFAYAYLRGPYSQLLYRNDGNFITGPKPYDTVNAHETGHLFGADDEYSGSGCKCEADTNGVLNGNCEGCNVDSQHCMMKDDHTGALCGYTPGQIGWDNVLYLSVETRRQDDGSLKDFFAPGEKVKYRATFCLFGPRLWKKTHQVRARFRANFFAGNPGASSSIAQVTPWLSSCCVWPSEFNRLLCWQTDMNTTIPLGVSYGPATLDCQLEVEGIGKSALSKTNIFYIAPGANKTESVAPAVDFNEEELVIQPAPPPWKR
jgi:hypothetical protein